MTTGEIVKMYHRQWIHKRAVTSEMEKENPSRR
jgi:hypothetical protein